MKRFYKEVTLNTLSEGFGVFLDGRPLRTPAKTVMSVPSRELAEGVQQEWASAGEEIKPEEMPVFSMAVTVLDRVTTQSETLCGELCDYAGNDLLFYRAGAEDNALDQQQAQLWTPWCEWASGKFGAQLAITDGLMPINQPPQFRGAVSGYLDPLSDWHLGILYRAVTLSGSFILGLAFFEREIDAEKLFRIAFLEELHQNEIWGLDSEAEKRQKQIEQELRDLERFSVML